MKRTKFLQDLAELLVFGTGLWGLIALLSLLLPIVNAVVGIIPLEAGIAGLATALAVIAGFFAFAYSFTEKSHVLEFEMRRPFFRGEIVNPRRDMLHSAAARFAWGLISLVAYFALVAVHSTLLSDNPEAAKWLVPIIEPLSVVFYGIAFGLVTGAFGSIAIMQHVRARSEEAEARALSLGIRNRTSVLQKDHPLPSSPDGVDDSHEYN